MANTILNSIGSVNEKSKQTLKANVLYNFLEEEEEEEDKKNGKIIISITYASSLKYGIHLRHV